MKFGVVRFPGSCDEVDALLAARARRRGRAALARATATCSGVDAVVVPGGFSYGDYLRAGAIARFAPVMEAVARVRRATAARCSASATASRCCARRACCPGALLPNTSLRFICRQVDLEVVNADTPFTRACARGRARSRSRSSTRPAATTRPTRCSTSSRRRPGRAALRAGPEPQRLAARHRRRLQRSAGNVVGLMPHPEHAVDPLTGSADGLKLFESVAPRRVA